MTMTRGGFLKALAALVAAPAAVLAADCPRPEGWGFASGTPKAAIDIEAGDGDDTAYVVMWREDGGDWHTLRVYTAEEWREAGAQGVDIPNPQPGMCYDFQIRPYTGDGT